MAEAPCPVAAGAARWPDAPALVMPGKAVSYAALDARIGRLAAGLTAADMRPGDRIGVLMEPGEPLVALLFALARVGAVACPVSLRLPLAQVAPLLHRIAAAGLIADRAVPGIAAVTPPEAADRAPPAPRPLAEPATVVFTSGSSGLPKAVLHSRANHHFSALGAIGALRVGPGDRWLLSLPLYHVGGLGVLWRCFMAGATVALPAPGAPLAESLGSLAVTHLSVVPTQLHRLLPEMPEGGWPALRAVISGGDATPAPLLAEAVSRGLPVRTTYGCTEAAALVTLSAAGRPGRLPQGAGRRLPHRRLRVAPSGEIEIAGRTLALGYLAAEGLTPLPGAGGWFATGDIGRIDADGTLHVLGRCDRRFVSGGENVHPEAIEQALAALPGVAQAAVVAVPDPAFGHRPVAFLRLDGPGCVTGPEALARVRAALDAAATLPRFMYPVRLLPWPQEPDGPAMKPDRRLLARLAAQGG